MLVARTAFAVVAIGALGIGAASPAIAATSGTEHFTVVNTSTTQDPPPVPISANGPIHALGRDKVLSNTTDRFNFPNGSLLIAHKPKHDRQTGDPGSCTFRFTETGTYTVISGSGAYVHAHGSGTYHLSGIVIGCSQTKTPLVSVVTINASGPLFY